MFTLSRRLLLCASAHLISVPCAVVPDFGNWGFSHLLVQFDGSLESELYKGPGPAPSEARGGPCTLTWCTGPRLLEEHSHCHRVPIDDERRERQSWHAELEQPLRPARSSS